VQREKEQRQGERVLSAKRQNESNPRWKTKYQANWAQLQAFAGGCNLKRDSEQQGLNTVCAKKPDVRIRTAKERAMMGKSGTEPEANNSSSACKRAGDKKGKAEVT